MTREEAKKLLPIIKAYAEGKSIEMKSNGKWIDVSKTIPGGFVFYLSYEYRIKPEPKYRPFKNAEECWAEMQKHQPFGWVRRYNEKPLDEDEESGNYQEKGYYGYYHIDWVYKAYIFIEGHEFYFNSEDQRKTMSVCMDYYTFADGAPFGIKVEED